MLVGVVVGGGGGGDVVGKGQRWNQIHSLGFTFIENSPLC